MQRIRDFWNATRNFMIIFSFIMNFVLLLLLLLVGQQLFMIKNGIAEPLIDGLHSNFVGMDEAEINTVIPVEDEITIDFVLPIDQQTTVVLTEPVPLVANTNFDLGGQSLNGTVSLNLPIGLQLPVQLNMNVPVNQQIPIALNVDVNIPLKETELHQPFVNLRNLFDPFVRVLDNLPSNWGETPDFAVDAVQGDVNVWAETEGSRNPWYNRDDVVDDRPNVGAEEAPPTGDDALSTEAPTDQAPRPTLDPNFTPAPTATTVPLVIPDANTNAESAPAEGENNDAGEAPAATPEPQG